MTWQPCPEALDHGPADRQGRCPWCHRKITSKMPRDWSTLRKQGQALQDPLEIEPDLESRYYEE